MQTGLYTTVNDEPGKAHESRRTWRVWGVNLPAFTGMAGGPKTTTGRSRRSVSNPGPPAGPQEISPS